MSPWRSWKKKAHSSWSWNKNDDNSKNKTKQKSSEIKLHVYTISFSFVNCATWLLCNIVDNGNNVAQVQHLLQRLHLLRVPQLCHCSPPVCRHQPVPQSSLPSLWSWGSLNGVDNDNWCWKWLLCRCGAITFSPQRSNVFPLSKTQCAKHFQE